MTSLVLVACHETMTSHVMVTFHEIMIFRIMVACTRIMTLNFNSIPIVSTLIYNGIPFERVQKGSSNVKPETSGLILKGGSVGK